MIASPKHRAAASAVVAGLRKLSEGIRATQAARIWPEIADPTDAQRAAMRYGIDCEGVTVHDLGPAFAYELQALKGWCRENCTGQFAVEPIRDAAVGRDTGRRFRFAEEFDAAAFRLFCR